MVGVAARVQPSWWRIEGLGSTRRDVKQCLGRGLKEGRVKRRTRPPSLSAHTLLSLVSPIFSTCRCLSFHSLSLFQSSTSLLLTAALLPTLPLWKGNFSFQDHPTPFPITSFPSQLSPIFSSPNEDNLEKGVGTRKIKVVYSTFPHSMTLDK